MKKSAFLSWFRSQHGKRPVIGGTDSDLITAIMAGSRAQQELRDRNTYDARLQSALYAWTAKDKPESEILKQLKK